MEKHSTLEFKQGGQSSKNCEVVRARLFSLSLTLLSSALFPEFHCLVYVLVPIPVAERSKAWVYSRSSAGISGSNLAEGMDVCLL